jgi:hypothetical protein
MILEHHIGEKTRRQSDGGNQEHHGTAGDQQTAVRQHQLYGKRDKGGRHQRGHDPHGGIAEEAERRRPHERKSSSRRIKKQRRQAQVELGIETEKQPGGDGDRQRDDQSGAAHGRPVYPMRIEQDRRFYAGATVGGDGAGGTVLPRAKTGFQNPALQPATAQ